MAKAAGYKSILAVVKEASDAYGTAVVVTEMLPFLSEDIKETADRVNDESLIGQAGFNRTFKNQSEYSGPVEFNLDYGSWDLLIAAALGAAGSPSLVTDLYSNTYTLTSNVDISATLAENKDVVDATGLLHEWPGVKVDKLTLKGTAGGPITGTLDLIAQNHYTTGDGNITNSKANISAATLLSIPVTMFEDMVFSVADNVNALAGGDAICIGNFEFTIDNGLRRLLTNCALDEPDREKRRGISLKIGIPSYTSDQFKSWRDANTELQALIQCSRSVSGVTDDYYNELRLGKIQVSDFQTPTAGEGIIAPTVDFNCLRATTDNPTWAAMTEECEFYVINGRSTSPLA